MITIIAWTLAKLSHIFPNTFYVEVFLKNPKQAPYIENIKATRWHPTFVDKFIKSIPIKTTGVRPSQF